MKILKYISVGAFAMVFGVACNEGIDDISYVAPGPDETAPTITVSYPIEGTKVQVKEDVAPIDIQFEATDDIEIKDIAVSLDGTVVATLTDFKDYRRALQTYTYESLTNGDHALTVVVTDLSGKSSSASVNFEKVPPYQPVFEGETLYMPFDGDYMDLVRIANASKVGSPGFNDAGKVGKSYAGAADGYLTLPTTGITTNEFSAAFWYNLNSAPDRSGILTIGPPDPNLPATPNNRKSGFRFFREGSATNQTFKLNVGDGAADSWFDGGAAASLNPATTDWVHLAFTISDSQVVVYINGTVVSQGSFAGVDWTGCDILSIASGAPRFTEWGHLSDQSLFDELRMFNKALTKDEIVAIMEH
ncbi:MAG TPA: LamG-like jellyroll fold domain-containing protein [Chryseolinea sp.]